MKVGILEIRTKEIEPRNTHANKRRAQKILRSSLRILKDMDAYNKNYMPDKSYDDMNMARIYLTAAVLRLDKLAS